LNTILGPSHIYFLKTGEYGNWNSDPKWDWDSIQGWTSMPIYHKTFVDESLKRSNSGKYDNIFVFSLKSVLFNSISDWMDEGLKTKDCSRMMDHNLYINSMNNDEGWYIMKAYLHDERVINISNNFLKMWIEWYIKNIKNVKLIYWCQFSDEYSSKRNWKPHISYTDLMETYGSHSVDLELFAKEYDMSRVWRDLGFHPSTYGYECLREFLPKGTIL